MTDTEITKSLLLFELSGKLSVAINTLNEIKRCLFRMNQIDKKIKGIDKTIKGEVRLAEFDAAFSQIVEIDKELIDEQLVFIKEIKKACHNYDNQ